MSQSTRRLLTSVFQKALKVDKLPLGFEAAAYSLKDIPSKVFKHVPPLRRILINGAMLPCLGVYFSSRLESTPVEQPNWKTLGWTGETEMMMLPTLDTEEWVILHEFGHYLDDVLFQALQPHQYGFSMLYPSRVEKFLNLRCEMFDEYTRARREVTDAMTERFDLDCSKNQSWWKVIPADIVYPRAVSRYACVSYSEWVAEHFQTWVRSPWSALPPKTTAFMEFFVSGELFQNPHAQLYLPGLPLAVSVAQL
jgi:hypothetical protein